jgi:hypothetical protein
LILQFIDTAPGLLPPFDRKPSGEGIGQPFIRSNELRIGLQGKSDVEALTHGSPIGSRDLKRVVQ